MDIMWLITIVGGPLLLLAAIIYGTIQYRKRDKRIAPLSDRKARDLREKLSAEDAGIKPRQD